MTPSEESILKVEQIKNEARRYIKIHRKFPNNINLTKEELLLIREARKCGIIPEIIYKGEKRVINVKYGGYR